MAQFPYVCIKHSLHPDLITLLIHDLFLITCEQLLSSKDLIIYYKTVDMETMHKLYNLYVNADVFVKL